jgi:alpha-beta hydrolase superfamily lysophospholipase
MDLTPFAWTRQDGETALGWQAQENSRAASAVLYLPGFSDTFFHDHVCQAVTELGWQFWVLEPHRWGRAISPGIPPYHCQDLAEFDEDILLCLREMKEQGVTRFVLLGHSTGGLLAWDWTVRSPDRASQPHLIGAVFNSPFLDFNLPPGLRGMLKPLLPIAGRLFPTASVRGGLTRHYGDSIHAGQKGEWNFDLKIKPIPAHPTTFGFLWAVAKAQGRLRRLPVPSLILTSDRSWNGAKWSEEAHTSDAVLNVVDMARVAGTLETPLLQIPGARHDVFLSQLPVRLSALSLLREFLSDLG